VVARRELGPATLAVVQAVEAAVSDADRSLLVACSGGADSLTLAVAAVRVADRRSLSLAAVVVDHQLQDGSDTVARAARDELVRLGCADVVVRSVAVQRAAPAGPEAAAREARYRALEEEARPRGATVLLGHTLDDQAETVLLGLARGSGPRSLAGMAPRQRHLLRPLLGVRRSTTEAACAELGLSPWRDPHNADPAFARVRVRERVLPVLEAELGPGVAAALARTAELARADADLLDLLAAESDPGTDILECRLLAELPEALRRRVLRRWLARHGGSDVTLQHIQAIETLVTDWRGQRGVDVSGAVVTRRAGQLTCQRRTDRVRSLQE